MTLMRIVLSLIVAAAGGIAAVDATTDAAGPGDAHMHVRGMTISCQTWGREWGTDGFCRELDELKALGANWVAIHPYASIRAGGELRWRDFDPADPPQWLARPIEEAHRRGMCILIKPHLAYWGSSFRWRGDVDFEQPEELDRFFASYREWICKVAEATRGADAFCVMTELDRLTEHEDRWREVIAAVRGATDAHLTLASNWSDYSRIAFWDALDVIGVQAYFPLSGSRDPDEAALKAGWKKALVDLQDLVQRTGKPAVFTELGYDCSLDAAARPWESARHRSGEGDPQMAAAVQRRCLKVALEVLEAEKSWLRGAFLWKWFVGEAPGEDFVVDRPPVRAVLEEIWGS